MRNGKLNLIDDTPVSLYPSSTDSTSTGDVTYYLRNVGPGDIRVGVNDGIGDGSSGLPLEQGERVEIRHTGPLFVVSDTATDLAPVGVHFVATGR